MFHRDQKPFWAWLVAVLGLVGWAGSSQALQISGLAKDDPRCDPISSRLVEELGLPVSLGGPFPLSEGISFSAVLNNVYVCVPDDGAANDWDVTMTNLTGRAFGDPVGRPLFFVANTGNTIGNSDGTADWSVPVPGIPATGFADAFKIDSTGHNANLFFESIVADDIFAPGETWMFRVTNFVVPAALGAAPAFLSLGHSVGVSSGGGTASIVVGVPEPATWAMMALGGLGLGGLVRSRRRKAV